MDPFFPSLFYHALFQTPIIGQLGSFFHCRLPDFFYPHSFGNVDSSSHMIMQVELGFDNGVVDDIFFASGYDIRGYVVAQVCICQHPTEHLFQLF